MLTDSEINQMAEAKYAYMPGFRAASDEYNKLMENNRDAFIAGAKAAMDKMKWVSVNDKHPTEGQKCLVWHEKLGYQVAPYYAELDGFCSVFIKLWHPLPSPPSDNV